MAKKKDANSAGDALRDLEQTGDRVAAWAAANALGILIAVAVVLMLAAGAGLYVQHGSDARDQAADALALVTSQYRIAMGADPIGGTIVEPANPELAERTRTDFVERFKRVASEHDGTTAGVVAWLEAGNLQVELGRPEDASVSFAAARDAAGDLALGALASTRLAVLAEDRGDPAAAAEAYEAAAAVSAYPLRLDSLAAAARCWLDAGEADRALTVYQRVESEFPDQLLAPQIESLFAELRLRRRP